jgi:hypothetical protein
MKSSCREGCHGPARAAKLTMPQHYIERRMKTAHWFIVLQIRWPSRQVAP